MTNDIYKNPILHGIIGGAVAGIILYIINNNHEENSQESSKVRAHDDMLQNSTNSKQYRKKSKRIMPDVIPMLIFGLIVWFCFK